MSAQVPEPRTTGHSEEKYKTQLSRTGFYKLPWFLLTDNKDGVSHWGENTLVTLVDRAEVSLSLRALLVHTVICQKRRCYDSCPSFGAWAIAGYFRSHPPYLPTRCQGTVRKFLADPNTHL